jgi:hypothetical protein
MSSSILPQKVDPETKSLMLLAHAALGRRIFPTAWIIDGRCSCGKDTCIKQGKHPRVSEWQHRATTDADQIMQWHAWVPLANWGWVQDTTFTLDIDPDRGGLDALTQWEENADGPGLTFRQRTQSGGWHFVYRQPEVPLRQQGDILPGIEIRGVGSYIMLGGVSWGLRGAWTLVDPDAAVAEADDFTLALIESNGLLLDDGDGVERRGGKRKKSAGAGGEADQLPSTEQFLEKGFGWHSGSRNKDAYRLAWRLLAHGERFPDVWTNVQIARVMKRCWDMTDQGDAPFPWDECLGTLRSAWQRREKQKKEDETKLVAMARSLVGGR